MANPEWLYTRLGKVVVDALTLCIALVVAYLLRFEGSPPAEYVEQGLTVGPYVVFLTLLSLGISGQYNRVWRYTNLRDAMLLPTAIAAPLAIFLALRLTLPDPFVRLRLPISVIATYFTFGFAAMLGVRASWRLVFERRRRAGIGHPGTRRVLILGAGDAGIRLARDLAHRSDVRVVGFIDDAVRKAYTKIIGVPVRGTTADLARVVVALRVDELIVTLTLAESRFRALVDECEAIPVRVRVLALNDDRGTDHVSGRLRDVRIEDLLPRTTRPFEPAAPQLVETYRGRRVLVTGGGGSIGSELCRRVMALGPDAILVLDQDENNLFETCSDLIHAGAPRQRVIQIIADIRDAAGMRRVFERHRPDVILHAAAFKHVPFLEEHLLEAVENNVLATASLVELAVQHGIRSFVLISTDKAVVPTSVMGATKRAAELVVQQAAGRGTRVSCVRFGNVLDSRGSVIPIFRRQISRGGPVTVTDRDATRFFMTIGEAAQLVLQAGSLGGDGEIFVLDMGEPVRIVDLARDLIRLSGLKEPDDIEIQLVGLRPGERLHERLSDESSALTPTGFEGILVAAPAPQPPLVIRRMLRQLADAVEMQDETALIQALTADPIQLQRETTPSVADGLSIA